MRAHERQASSSGIRVENLENGFDVECLGCRVRAYVLGAELLQQFKYQHAAHTKQWPRTTLSEVD